MGPLRAIWRRFDTLGTRLFLAMAAANVLVAVVGGLVAGWAFDRSLADYLDQAERQRLAPLVARLADEYRQQGDWQWVRDDHGRWHALLREELGVGPGPRPARREAATAAMAADRDHDGDAEDDRRAARRDRSRGAEGRLVLTDAQRQPIEGSAERLADARWLPIALQGQVVGWLAQPQRRDMLESLEQAFAARQVRQFGWIVGAGALAMVLAAALAARWLSLRLAPLGRAAAAVAEGDYAVRLSARGHDELAQLADDFNRMAAALQAARRARQQWVADIAHELRTPLATLRAEVEALQDGVRQPSPDRLASLAQEVGRLSRLVEDLRVLSLSDIGALNVQRIPIDLGTWLNDWLDDEQLRWPPGLALRRAIAIGVPVALDETRFAQVCANLLRNSARYTDRPGQLQVALTQSDGQACLVWEDSAPGVPEALWPQLTERLFRVDAARTRQADDDGGSGLGLAIVQAIVEAHGGRLQPGASSLGGLRWTIWLPLEPAR